MKFVFGEEPFVSHVGELRERDRERERERERERDREMNYSTIKYDSVLVTL